jgi:uroporphyrinogen-III decarboxylase
MRQETMTPKQRIEAAIRLEKPDRVPVIPMIGTFAGRHCGLKMQRFYEDHQACMEAAHKTFEDLGGLDGIMMAGPNDPRLFANAMPIRVRVPGKELPEDAVIQIDESKPVIEVEDYDTIINKGWNYFATNVIALRLSPDAPRGLIGKIKSFLGMLPIIRESQADTRWYAEHGVPVLVGGMILMPFELFCMGRTLHEFYVDLFRMPDKIIAAADAAIPELIASAVDLGKRTKAPWVFIGGTRGSAAMISGKTFEKFYLPYLKRAVDAIIAAGLTPLYHFDSDWTGHLPYFTQMPKAKCILEIDSATDIFKAKEVLRGHTCIMGDVPATLFKLGTPAQVVEYCKKLIDVVGTDGGFILSSGCEVPHDAKWENVKAMVDFGKTYELSQG